MSFCKIPPTIIPTNLILNHGCSVKEATCIPRWDFKEKSAENKYAYMQHRVAGVEDASNLHCTQLYRTELWPLLRPQTKTSHKLLVICLQNGRWEQMLYRGWKVKSYLYILLHHLPERVPRAGHLVRRNQRVWKSRSAPLPHSNAVSSGQVMQYKAQSIATMQHHCCHTVAAFHAGHAVQGNHQRQYSCR